MRRRMLMAALASAVLSARAVPNATPGPAATPAPMATPAPTTIPAPAAESRPPPSPAATEFMAAMQRVRMNLPEPSDSAALKAYPIYDYLLAARLRRDLGLTPGEELDAAIDTFLRAHEGQPVGRGLKHQWLVSLAQRRRWDWFLP